MKRILLFFLAVIVIAAVCVPAFAQWDTKKTTLQSISDSLALALLKTTFDDSLKKNLLPRTLAIPSYIDTTAQDSLVIEPYFLYSAFSDTSTFVRARSTSNAATDSLRLGMIDRFDCAPDSITFKTRGSNVGSKLHVMVIGRSGTVYLNQIKTPAVVDIWEHSGFAPAAAAKKEEIIVLYIPMVVHGTYIDFTGIRLR